MSLPVLVDMNLSPVWVDWLAERGLSAVHWSAVGNPRASDRTVLAWAAEHRHVLLTHDLDFGSILAAAGSTAPSVLQVRARDVTPEGVGASVLNALRHCESDLSRGALVAVDEESMRLRLLPLK
jgi:predicted nuclease of predicted toxin-antitoxin system